MRKLAAVILIIFSMLLVSCTDNKISPSPDQSEIPDRTQPPTPSSQPSPEDPELPEPEPGGSSVEENILTREYLIDGEKVAVQGNLYISLPAIESEDYPENATLISDYFESLIHKTEDNFLTELNAVNDPGNEYGSETVSRYIDVAYITEYNRNNILSFYITTVSYSGGAHDIITLGSETFDISKGVRIVSDNLFSVAKEEYSLRIKDRIIKEIESQNEGGNASGIYYYDNYIDLVDLTYDPESFVLTENGLKVYFQVYDLAPFAAGTISFTIPYGDLEDIWNTEYPMQAAQN